MHQFIRNTLSLPKLHQLCVNTALGNFLDWCGVSIPCGKGEADMPVGFLLSAPANRDDALLAVSLAAEAVIRGDRI